MPGANDLQNAAAGWIHTLTKREERKAFIGKLESDGSYTIEVPYRNSYWWVTLADGVIDQAVPRSVPRQGGFPVKIDVIDGQKTIVDIDQREAIHTTGGASLQIVGTHTHSLGSGLEYRIEARRIDAGLVKVGPALDLNVEILPFFYQFGGERKYYAGEIYDMTSDVPGSANEHAWVLVGIDPAPNAATSVAGVAQATVLALQTAQLADINFAGLIPLAGVKLTNGQTAIDQESYFTDARHWLGGDLMQDAKTAFGELLVAEPTPIVQLQFPYNVNEAVAEIRENNAGTVTQADSMAVLQSGASANSAAQLLSLVPVKYNAGQGALARFTALFTTGVANSEQTAGVGTIGDGLFFGYDGAAFGVLRRSKGHPEIQTLTISAGATNSGNITINLDSQATLVAVTAGDSIREVAVKIAATAFKDAGLGWTATIDNDTIIFVAWSDGDKSGTFSLVDTDTTLAAGSFAETVTGVAATDNWEPQTTWNVDKFDGVGPSRKTLDPTKGNVYQIQYQWLGFGMLTFSIENSESGEFQVAHQIRYANANVEPSLQNPTLPLCVMSKNAANTSNLTIKTSSMAGFVEGKDAKLPLFNADDSGLTTVGFATELPILSIKNQVVHQSVINRVEIEASLLALSTSSNKPVIFRFKLDPTLTGSVAFAPVDAATSVAAIDKAATGLTGGRQVFTTPLSLTDSEKVNLKDLIEKLRPGSILTVTAQLASAGSGQEVAAALNWEELI